jgi:hypothetical protein
METAPWDVQRHIQRWSFQCFGYKYHIKILAREEGITPAIRELEKQLHVIYKREELMFKQRSRQEWLKAGDLNTIFFFKTQGHTGDARTLLDRCVKKMVRFAILMRV